jgi:hypothetical protein
MFLATAIHALRSSDFGPLASRAISALQQDRSHEAAHEFIAQASLRSLPSLRPHLRELFELQPNWTTYYAMWAWRETGTSEFEFLAERAGEGKTFWQGGPTRTTERAALEALFETREQLSFKFLSMRLAPDQFNSLSLPVGFELNGRQIRKLYSDGLFHVVFPGDYFNGVSEAGEPLPMEGLGYDGPFWEGDFVMGGRGTGNCGVCGRHRANLLRLGNVPLSIGVTAIHQLAIEVCLPCLDIGVLFYQHDGNGTPDEIPNAERHPPKGEYDEAFLRRTVVRLVETPSRWRWQDWALSNGRENLNRFGGPPGWIQYSDYPKCPRCGETMTHLAQLDSDLPTENQALWLWGSGGCCYVSWCDGCKVSGVQYQCT